MHYPARYLENAGYRLHDGLELLPALGRVDPAEQAQGGDDPAHEGLVAVALGPDVGQPLEQPGEDVVVDPAVVLAPPQQQQRPGQVLRPLGPPHPRLGLPDEPEHQILGLHRVSLTSTKYNTLLISRQHIF